jgi:hypothetical protein
MAAVSSILLGVAAVGGLATQAYGMDKAADAQRDMTAASKKAEMARKEQARLQMLREQRKAFRDEQAARAVGISNAVNAGVDMGSSAYGGMMGQTSGALNQQIGDISANAKLGENIFNANAAYSTAQGNLATAQGIQSLGKDIFAAAGPISRVGSTIFGGPSVDKGIYDWNMITNVRKA